ncbi:MAG: nonstructural protein [Arizlama microvirus]|nr:MAG: nonstructural protein [Arizlama microvirus]
MIHYVLAVKDTNAGIYYPPFNVRHPSQGVRDFRDQINGKDLMAKHAGDFELHQIALFDDETGQFNGHADNVMRLARGADLKEAQE